MSISTTHGDGGYTDLAGGVRVSKTSPHIDSYGHVDELIATLGFARSICADAEIAAVLQNVQQDLFRVGSALATPPESQTPPVRVGNDMVERLTVEVHRLEAIEGMLADWAVSGSHSAAAAIDVARTVCRRAERVVVWLAEEGSPVQPAILSYLNRLSDLLWLLARKIELDAGVNGSLRASTGKPGGNWSSAW